MVSVAERVSATILLSTSFPLNIIAPCSAHIGWVIICAETLVEGFRQYPAQRSAVLDDIMGAVLPNLPTGKCTQRAFLIGDEEQLRTQMVSALMRHLVQVSPEILSTATAVYVSCLVSCRPDCRGWNFT